MTNNQSLMIILHVNDKVKPKISKCLYTSTSVISYIFKIKSILKQLTK